MGNPIYVIAYDVGTTGVKTCLFSITDKIELLGAASEGYNLYVYPDGGAQDPDEWWEAMRTSTHTVMKKAKIKKSDISGISFCSQMQALVLVDKEGNAVRRAMSYMDQRAREELKKGIKGSQNHRCGCGIGKGPGMEIQMGRGSRAGRIQQSLQVA